MSLGVHWIGQPIRQKPSRSPLPNSPSWRLHAAPILYNYHTPALVSQSQWDVPVVAVMHSCVGTWWEAVRGGALPPELAWRASAVAAGLRAADAVVAPSQAIADLVRQVYGPMTQMRVVHNGRTGPGSHPSGRPPSSRNGVLAIGRLWDEGKNISFLDRVAGRLQHIPFLAAGALCAPGGVPLS